ncbi:MAG TPA: hypothetical protein ENJ31_00900 [Anaerolineae bacterium]|nr:hypothetical protein [Anaerolineae bacterium]
MQFDRILFLCVANSARSQLAEALARRRFGDAVEVCSAGSQPSGRVNPYAIKVLEEIGIDTSDLRSKSIDEIDLDKIDLIVTLCAEESCPVVAAGARRLNWAMPDPDRKDEDLSEEERLAIFRQTRDAIAGRIEVLAALRDLPDPLDPKEFHASIRVPDIAEAARFYSWLLGVEPKEWTHRYVVFVSDRLRTNFVVLVDDGLQLHHDTLYHLGVELADRQAVIDAYHRAVAAGFPVHKPPRTTWRGTPLHELWLRDPGGNLVEIYARLTPEELARMPADKAPELLV